MPSTLIFDDRCGFCRRWAAVAKARVPALVLVKGSEALGTFPHLSDQDLQRSVFFIGGDGVLRQGANAVYGLWAEAGHPLGQSLYTSNRAFRWASDLGYWTVARLRRPLSLVLDFLLGPPADL